MDPRPYHFQYRRPRLSNPTFQSNSLYNSIYQFQGLQKSKELKEILLSSQIQQSSEKISVQSQPIIRHQSMQFHNPKIKQSNQIFSKIELRNNNNSTNLIKKPKNNIKQDIFQQSIIYKKQQRGFNIINCSPQREENLRQFPKLTLEDSLIEKKRNSRYYKV